MQGRDFLRYLWIIIHYGNFITDVLTLRTFFMQGYYWYFGLLLAGIFISWLVSGSAIIQNHGKTGLFVWLLHIDYIYLQFYDEKQEKRAFSTTNNKKLCTLFSESILSVLITVHSIFNEEITDLTPQISLSFSILDKSFCLAFFLLTDYLSGAVIDWKFFKQLLPWTLLMAIESGMFIIFWGFFTKLTRPWGVWSFYPASVILMTILSRWRKYESYSALARILFHSLGLGRIYIYPMLFGTNDLQILFVRGLQLLGFLTTFILARDELRELLEQTFWLCYMAVACGLLSLWLLILLYRVFYPIEMSSSDCHYSYLNS